MALTAPKSKSSEPVPKGNHVARLYQIIHIGTNSFEYMGETKSSDKIRLIFELSNERKVFKEGDEPKPFSISREFGFSMHAKSKLRPFIEGMLGTVLFDKEADNFDFESLLGQPSYSSIFTMSAPSFASSIIAAWWRTLGFSSAPLSA
jgi:hypothetical protein